MKKLPLVLVVVAALAHAQSSDLNPVAYQTVQDEATDLKKRRKVNFTGAGVSCSDDTANNRTNCSIGAGGGGCTPSGGAGEVLQSNGAGACQSEPAFSYNSGTNVLTISGTNSGINITGTGASLSVPAGSATAPGIFFAGAGSMSASGAGAGVAVNSGAGTDVTRIDNTGLVTRQSLGYGWANSDSNLTTPELALARSASGTLLITTGAFSSTAVGGNLQFNSSAGGANNVRFTPGAHAGIYALGLTGMASGGVSFTNIGEISNVPLRILTAPSADPTTASSCSWGGTGFVCEGSTADANETVLLVVDPTADNTYELPALTVGTRTVVSATSGTATPSANCSPSELYFETDAAKLWACTSAPGTWTDAMAGGGGAPTTAKYVTAQDDAGLSADIFPSADDQLATSDSATSASWKTLPNGALAYATAGNTFAQAGVSNLASSTSAQLRTVLSDEEGTGAALFGLTAAMADDLGCTGDQVVARNSGDTAFVCVTVAGGSGLSHPQVMTRLAVGGAY